MNPVVTTVLCAVLGCVLASPERPSLTDPTKAREMFHLAELNRTTVPDGFLNVDEVHSIFFTFDKNGDSQVEKMEFTLTWLSLGLGDSVSAASLFDRADTNHDGSLTFSPDLERIFHYFDQNQDGRVSEPEFVVVWSSLSS